VSLFPNDIDNQLACRSACLIPTFTAGAAGDNAQVNGISVDRKDATSASVVVTARAVLAATKTLTVKLIVQDSADGTTFTNVAAALQPAGAADSVVLTLTGGAGGSTENGQYQLGLNLASLRRYVRVQLTPDLNATGVDTATVAALFVLGGLVVEI